MRASTKGLPAAIRLSMVFLIALAAAACGHSNPWQGKIDHLRTEVSETTDAGAVTVRFNPSECDCPAWEMQLSGRWVRILIMESTDPALPLDALEKEGRRRIAAGEPATSTLSLSMEKGKPLFCSNGTPYFLMAVHPAGD